MSPRTLLLLLLAVVIAGGTALLARSYLASQRAQEVARVVAAPPKPQRSILVAKGDIARGQILRTENMSWQVWPDNAVTPAYIVQGPGQTPQSFAGWVAVDSISAGSPITKTTILSPGSGGFLAAVLKPGLRAVQVKTQSVDLPSLAVPGDRVDLLISFTDWRQQKAVETAMRGVRIIAIDGRQGAVTAPGLSPGCPLPAANGVAPQCLVTLEVTPKQAEYVTLARQMGSETSFALDSLRQGPEQAAAESGGVVAAAFDAKSDPPAADAASNGMPPRPVDGEAAKAAAPTYMVETQVNNLLHPPARPVTVQVTVLRGDEKPPSRPTMEDVPVSLRCLGQGTAQGQVCAVASDMPERLVGEQEPR